MHAHINNTKSSLRVLLQIPIFLGTYFSLKIYKNGYENLWHKLTNCANPVTFTIKGIKDIVFSPASQQMLVCCDLLNRSVKAWIEGRLLRARLNPLVELHLIVSALWGHKFSSCWVSYWSERSNLKFGKTLQLSSPCKSFTWEMRCKSSIVQLLHLIVINVTYTS